MVFVLDLYKGTNQRQDYCEYIAANDLREALDSQWKADSLVNIGRVTIKLSALIGTFSYGPYFTKEYVGKGLIAYGNKLLEEHAEEKRKDEERRQAAKDKV